MALQVIFRVISHRKRMTWWSTTVMEQVQKVNDLLRLVISHIALLSLLYLRYTDVLFNRTPRSVCDVC